MADLSITELQRQLANVEELLALIVHVSDEKVPQLKNDISNIVDKIQGGVDKEQIATQVRAVINKVLTESSYVKLERDIDTNTKKMIEAIEQSSRKVENWQDNYHNRSKWNIALIIGAICFCSGFGVSYWCNKPTVNQQQEIYSNIGIIAKYVRDNATPKASPITKHKKTRIVKDNSDDQSDNGA